MSLFSFKKKTKTPAPCTQGGCTCEQNTAKTSRIKVLGSGCAKCNQLEQATKEALLKLGMDTDIEHVTDFAVIASYGVMSTPALVVDEKVVSFGKVLTTDQVVDLLKQL